ncbi:MAG: N-acetyltransferase [Candidatus Acidiferrales bacterium]
MSFTVRKYHAGDFETLYGIDRICYSPEIAYTREELHWYLNLPCADCLVAQVRNSSKDTRKRTVGFIIAASQKTHGHIITIDVIRNHRRAGVGTSLLRKAENNLLRRGVREVWLETATDNEPAIAFWQKHGYRNRGRLRNYYPGGLDAFSMSKPLTKSAPTEK